MRHRYARGTIIGLAVGAAPAGALAQAPAPPRAFAGYSQPAIPATACKSLGPAETQCVIPAMTAGRYMIEASGTSTSQGVGANQVLEIDVGGGQCGVGRDGGSWTSGPRTFHLDCEVSLLADTPVTVRVIYADAQAVKDPKGPTVTFKPLPWNGVLSAEPFAPRQ
jgi:hypothetical protein